MQDCIPVTQWNPALRARRYPEGDSHMKQTGMLDGNFEFNP